MGEHTKISWSESTWNPLIGCTKVSPGCDNCYAKTQIDRWRGAGAFDTVQIAEHRLDQPLRWRNPRRIFVNSLSDLFHDQVPDDYIADVFAVMALTARHTYQLLTKRHARMRALLNSSDFQGLVAERASDRIGHTPSHRNRQIEVTTVNGWHVPRTHRGLNIWAPKWPLHNVWTGVSVEDQHWADIRIPALLNTPAAVRWLSCEPLLGPIDLEPWLAPPSTSVIICNRSGKQPTRHDARIINEFGRKLDGGAFIDWVIVGGESGPGAREMDLDWARSIQDECDVAAVPYHFKQLGTVLAKELGCHDRKGANPAEWPEPFPRDYPFTTSAQEANA